MQALTDSVELSLRSANWYAALMITLTLPDIAGKIEHPQENFSRIRYSNWFDKYVGHKYKIIAGPKWLQVEAVVLSGSDCYALRCAFLHEGIASTATQKARQVVDEFFFTPPPPKSGIGMNHRNRFGSKLQLRIDHFCNDILEGIHTWLDEIKDDTKKQQSLQAILRIHPSLMIRIVPLTPDTDESKPKGD